MYFSFFLVASIKTLKISPPKNNTKYLARPLQQPRQTSKAKIKTGKANKTAASKKNKNLKILMRR